MPRRAGDADYIIIENGSTGCWSSIGENSNEKLVEQKVSTCHVNLYVGRLGGGQVVNLQSPDCLRTIGTPMHELLHAVGFMHEQNREERDTFVNIRFNNVESGREKNFEKTKVASSGFGVAYDFGSVMHYSHVAFSKNGKFSLIRQHLRILEREVEKLSSIFSSLFCSFFQGKPTIDARVQPNGEMGQRNGFSRGDIEKINKMYKC